MSLNQIVHVRLSAMTADVPQTMTINLTELGSSPDFAAHQEDFICAVVDRNQTHVKLTELLAPGPEIAMAVLTSFQGPGAESWTPFMSFEGFIEESQSLEPAPQGVPQDTQRDLETLLLTAEPTLSLRVETEVAEDLELLALELDLVLFFSTRIEDCAERQAITETAQGEASVPAAL